MPSLTLGEVRRSGVAIGAACALALALSAFTSEPARAGSGDDGSAPIWVGLGSIVGLGGQDESAPIEYRDRGKLVLPPKVELPPPASPPTAANGPWPRDPDVERAKKEKAEASEYVFISPRKRLLRPTTSDSVVTTSATAGQAPGGRACVAAPGVACDTRKGPELNYNPLTWIGLEKKPQTVLGPEPDRDWLTDPPKGYREPVEGVGAHVDN